LKDFGIHIYSDTYNIIIYITLVLDHDLVYSLKLTNIIKLIKNVYYFYYTIDKSINRNRNNITECNNHEHDVYEKKIMFTKLRKLINLTNFHTNLYKYIHTYLM